MYTCMDSRHVLRTVPGAIGVGSLIGAVLVMIMLLGPFDAVDHANGGLVISSFGPGAGRVNEADR